MSSLTSSSKQYDILNTYSISINFSVVVQTLIAESMEKDGFHGDGVSKY